MTASPCIVVPADPTAAGRQPTSPFTALDESLATWLSQGRSYAAGDPAYPQLLNDVVLAAGSTLHQHLRAAGRPDLAGNLEARCSELVWAAWQNWLPAGDVDSREITWIWDRTRQTVQGLRAWLDYAATALGVSSSPATTGAPATPSSATPALPSSATDIGFDPEAEPDRPVPISQVPAVYRRLFPGRVVSSATAWRWTKAGIGGVRLGWQQLGGTRCTTPRQIRAFIERLTPANPRSVPISSPAQRRRRAERAAQELGELLKVRPRPSKPTT